jgi:hypothetical protein
VALFNAISKHRADAEAKIAEREEEKKRRAAAMDEAGGSLLKKRKKECEENNNTATTKHGFLDMIKKSSVTTATTMVGESITTTTTTRISERDFNSAVPTVGPTPARSVGWNALKDDFMMNSKLKDWDKEISDDDE